jgi:hypothetical protein
MLDDRARSLVVDFLNTVPCTSLAFAYGSAVFPQSSQPDAKEDDKSRMLDVILFVNDAVEWHAEVRIKHCQLFSSSLRLLHNVKIIT